MTAKEYLNQARLLDQRINAKLDRVTRLRELTTRVTAAMDSEIVSHTRLVDLKKEVSEVLTLIHDPDCQLLLELRYLCFRGWEEIAEVMHFHIRTVYKLHGRALQKLSEVLDSVEYRAIHEKWAVEGT